MNKAEFLKLEVSQISQVYDGKRDCCRCGCGGTYTSTSFMKDARSDINDELVAKHLKKAKKLVEDGADTINGDTYFDVQSTKHKTLTFYLDDLK